MIQKTGRHLGIRAIQCLVLMHLFIGSSASAANLYETHRFVAGTGPAFSTFGNAVAIDNNTVLVGGLGWDAGLKNTVLLYRRENNQWILHQKLTASNGLEPYSSGQDVYDYNDGFGGRLAIDGGTAAVGSIGYRDANTAEGDLQGAVYIFTEDADGDWTETQIITDNTQLLLGMSLAIDNNTLVVAARDEAIVYEPVNGTWQETARLGEIAGTSQLAIDNNTIVASSKEEGGVFIFVKTTQGWVQQQFIAGDNLGSVAISGSDVGKETLVIGDSHPAGQSVSVYIKDDGVWRLEQKLINNSEDPLGDGFGHKVAVVGDHIVVTSPYDEKSVPLVDSGSVAGSAYLYQRQDGVWTQKDKYFNSDRSQFKLFGWSLAMDEKSVLVGAPGDYAESAGSANLFYLDDGACVNPDNDGWAWQGSSSCRLALPVEVSECVDNDGDGWGWNGRFSCLVADGCDYSNADQYDGWGWDPVTEQSCPPKDDDSLCDYSSADIQSGWGWDETNQRSCPPL